MMEMERANGVLFEGRWISGAVCHCVCLLIEHPGVPCPDKRSYYDKQTLSFGSSRLYGPKITNALYERPRGLAVARSRGFGVLITVPLCYRRRFFVQRAHLMGL